MRKLVLSAVVLLAVGGCANGGGVFGNRGPDEFAVARAAPLVIPPDFALTPPAPGQPRVNEQDSSRQALEALFGGPAARSAAETAALQQAGSDVADPGIRSQVGDPGTVVANKGATTQAILNAPEGDGTDAKATVPAPATPK